MTENQNFNAKQYKIGTPNYTNSTKTHTTKEKYNTCRIKDKNMREKYQADKAKDKQMKATT
jgi:hypothetical protein